MTRFPVSRPSIGELEKQSVQEVLDAGWLTHGPLVEQFEHEFATLHSMKHGVATSSGTTALHLALVAAGIGKGDEVLVPDLSFVATANAVVYTGADPVLVDVDPITWGMDVDEARLKLTGRTRAALPVYLYGRSPRMAELRRLVGSLPIIEDACEALGSDDLELGQHAEMSVYSFYGNKVITTGEGGMVLTNDDYLRDRLYHLRGQGMTEQRYYHDELGFNYRMTSVQAAIGLAQLRRLHRFLGERDVLFKTYFDEFQGVLQTVGVDAAPWLFTILLPEGVNRREVAERLEEEGIETRPMFVPMHQLPMYKRQGNDIDFPVATKLGARGLSLPTYVGLTPNEARRIAHRTLNAIEAVGGAACLNVDANG